jgi:hypothetical protein
MSGRTLDLADWRWKFKLREQFMMVWTRIDWEIFGGLPSQTKEHSIMLGM